MKKTPTQKEILEQILNLLKAQNEASPKLAFSMTEAAQKLGVCYTTVWNLIERGKLHANRDLRTPLISRAEIDRWLAS